MSIYFSIIYMVYDILTKLCGLDRHGIFPVIYHIIIYHHWWGVPRQAPVADNVKFMDIVTTRSLVEDNHYGAIFRFLTNNTIFSSLSTHSASVRSFHIIYYFVSELVYKLQSGEKILEFWYLVAYICFKGIKRYKLRNRVTISFAATKAWRIFPEVYRCAWVFLCRICKLK